MKEIVILPTSPRRAARAKSDWLAVGLRQWAMLGCLLVVLMGGGSTASAISPLLAQAKPDQQASIPEQPPVTAASLMGQVVEELHGVPISVAPANVLLSAMEKVVAKNPKEAVAIVAIALSMERADMQELAGPLISAAIRGVGSAASSALLVNLVRIGIELQPAATLSIVRSAVEGADRPLVLQIVQAAVQSRGLSKRGAEGEARNTLTADGKNAIDGKNVLDNKEVIPPETDALNEIAKAVADARPDLFPNVDSLLADLGNFVPEVEDGLTTVYRNGLFQAPSTIGPGDSQDPTPEIPPDPKPVVPPDPKPDIASN